MTRSRLEKARLVFGKGAYEKIVKNPNAIVTFDLRRKDGTIERVSMKASEAKSLLQGILW